MEDSYCYSLRVASLLIFKSPLVKVDNLLVALLPARHSLQPYTLHQNLLVANYFWSS